MVGIFLPLVLGVAVQIPADAPSRPTENQLKRARQLLVGTWELLSIVDNGESLGPALIRSKVAVNSQLVIGDRMIQITTPDTDAARVSAYRINPSADPKQIDVITETDKLLRGIYKFEGNQLVVCLQNKETGSRPDGFAAEAGSDRVLLRLHLSTPTIAGEPTRPTRPPVTVRFDEELFPVRPAGTPTPAQLTSAPVIQPSAQPLSEAEVRRAHQMLLGAWQVVGLQRNGEVIGAQLFKDKISRDGRITIGNRVITMVSPQTGEKRVSSFRISPNRDPKQIDIITELDDVKKGIYKFNNNELWLCVNEYPDSVRPVAFEAPDGSNNMLVRLRLVEDPPVVKPVVATRPAPPPEPSAVEKARQREAQIRKMLVGSWSYVDAKGTLTLLLQSDGTVTATRYWAKAAKRLFDGATTTSRGRWSYGQGWLRVDVLSSQDFAMAGRTYYGHLKTIGDESVVAEDVLGRLMTYRRLQ